MEEKSFKLTINGEVMLDLKAEGSEEIVKKFTDELAGNFGLFYKMKDQMITIILNHMEVTMSTVFRDKKGHFIKPPNAKLEQVTP